MISKIKAVVKELGLINTFLYGINNLLSRLNMPESIFHYRLYAQPVKQKPILPERRGKKVKIREVLNNDAVLSRFPPPVSVIQSRYKQGCICFGAFIDNEIVGYLWLAMGRYDEDEVRCRFALFPEGQCAWDFDVYVWPEHRMSFVFLKLWDAANKYMSERRIQWTFSRISAFNNESLSSHTRLGAVKIGNAIFVKIFAVQLMFANIAPYVHFSSGDSSLPTISLTPPS